MGKKASTTDIIDNCIKTKSISEQEINLLKRRLNAGESIDLSEFKKFRYKLDGTQESKGVKYLRNQLETSKGVERKNNPFTEKEASLLRKDNIELTFGGFRNKSILGNNYVQTYIVMDRNNSDWFNYYVWSGKVIVRDGN